MSGRPDERRVVSLRDSLRQGLCPSTCPELSSRHFVQPIIRSSRSTCYLTVASTPTSRSCSSVVQHPLSTSTIPPVPDFRLTKPSAKVVVAAAGKDEVPAQELRLKLAKSVQPHKLGISVSSVHAASSGKLVVSCSGRDLAAKMMAAVNVPDSRMTTAEAAKRQPTFLMEGISKETPRNETPFPKSPCPGRNARA